MKHILPVVLQLLIIMAPQVSKADRPVDYWQQEVNYRIDVALMQDLRTIDGTIEIEYINNSPDSLAVLYLKAFPNAIQKDSYADEKRQSYGDWTLYGRTPANQGSLELRDRQSSSKPYSSFETDNTIITVNLIKPIMSGDTLVLEFEFTTILPDSHDMRMGLTEGTTKAAYWYPQVCVYDRRMGWVNSQYIGWAECYGDFGRFDLTITAPEDQIVAATGVLVNSDEVMPTELSQKLHISNFRKPSNEWPQFDFDPEKTKTWHFIAEKVNDFAFTTSNQFCIDSGEVNGVAVVAYALRKKAEGWKDAVRLGKEAIETFSELYYPYQWPVMRICDAFSGMEYPMLTNCSRQGPDQSFSMLIYHEIGHQWFMGQVGSNQVDRPFLDEGFTTSIEHVAMEKYYGREGNYNHFSNWYQRKFSPPFEDRNVRGFRPLMLMLRDGLDKPGLFSYDKGDEYFPHRVSAYYKSAAMHYSLRSILGDSAYFAAMHHYCEDWFFGHPYEDDFTRSIEEATGLQLVQYLNQWYHSRYRIDYAYDGKETHQNQNGYDHTIKLKRPGRFIAPIDVAVIWESGDTSNYTVAPEGMGYAKPGYELVPTWNQFRRKQEKFEFTIESKQKISKVVIDPDNLLMDVNRMNNQSGIFGAIELRLDNMLYDRPPVNEYALRIRPDIWYDRPNGALIGFHAHGSYLETKNKFSLDARVGTKSERPMIDFSYSTPFPLLGNMSESFVRYLRADRRSFITGGFQKKFTRWHSARPDHQLLRLEFSTLGATGEVINRRDDISSALLPFVPGSVWESLNTWYSTFSTQRLQTFRLGSLLSNSSAIIGGFGKNGREGFSQVQISTSLDLKKQNRIWLQSRVEFIFSSGQPPAQLLYHLSRARTIDAFTHSQLFRSPGSFPNSWENDFYLSGERVRGYQDRTLFITRLYGFSVQWFPNDSFLSRVRAALRNVNFVGHVLSQFRPNLFVEGAWITMDNKEFVYPSPVSNNETRQFGADERLWASAGLSVQLPSIWKGQRVRLDFPLYLNRPLPGDNEFEFRFSAAWVLPVGN